MPIPPNVPIVNAGVMYVNGLQIIYSGGTKFIEVLPGAARDSSNSNDIVLDANAVINGAVIGANGVDAAPLVASSLYAVYLIGSSTSLFTSNVDLGGGPLSPSVPAAPYQPAGLLSLNYPGSAFSSQVAPYLPVGYDMYRRVGWVFTNSSAEIYQMWQYGYGEDRWIWWDLGMVVLSAGGANTSTPVPLAAAVPPIVTQIEAQIYFIPAAAGHFVSFAPIGSAGAGNVVYGTGAALEQFQQLTIPAQLNSSGVPAIQYAVSNSGDTVSVAVTGFADYLK